MKFPVLWLASESLSVWVGTEKGVRLAWDLVSRSRITLHFGAKAVKPNQNQILICSVKNAKASQKRIYRTFYVSKKHERLQKIESF